MGSILRDSILKMEPQGSGRRGEEPATIIMDFYVGDTVVSVMSASTGDASIYFSTGGGIIGGGAHESVRDAAQAFARAAAAQRAQMTRVTEHPYPEKGKVRFYLRTHDGLQMAETTDADLASGENPLSSLYRAGQEVVTRLRAISGKPR
jgi:hypothetical protein